MTLSEIIQDIHGLDAELVHLEKRYGLLSSDFYHLYKAGELEQSRDFIQWVGYYEAKLDRESRYRELLNIHISQSWPARILTTSTSRPTLSTTAF